MHRHGLHNVLQLLYARGAGNRCRQSRARHEPSKSNLSRRGILSGGDLIEGCKNPFASLVEVGRNAAAADALSEIGFGPVLAGQEPAGETVIGDDADLLLTAERLQVGLVFGPVMKIVFRLQAFVARQAELGADLQSFLQSRSGKVGSANSPHLSVSDQLLIGLERLLLWRVEVVAVGLIEIDMVCLETLEGSLN